MRESSGFRMSVITAAAGVLLATATAVVYLLLGGVLRTGETFHIRAALPTSASLTTGARVTMAGAKVGRVNKVQRQGEATVVDMVITDERVTPIPADTRVTLSQRTPVGEAYIALAPGRSSTMLPESAVLPMRQSDEYVDVDQLLTVLRGRSKDEARHLIQGAGEALDGNGKELNLVLGRASQVVQSAGHVFTVLQDNKAQTAQLVQQIGRISAAISERGAAIESVADRGLAAFHALGSRDKALKRTLDVLPPTLIQVKRTSETLRATSATATPVVARLAATVGDLRPAVADLGPTAATGRRVVAELGRAAPPLTKTLDEVSRLSRPLSAALPPLHKTLCQLNPMVRYMAPYAKDLLWPVFGLGSSSNAYDAIGHTIRMQAIVGDTSLIGVPKSVSAAADTLLHSGLFVKGLGQSWNPYPAPGKRGLERAGTSGNIFNAEALKKSGYVYPRIYADC